MNLLQRIILGIFVLLAFTYSLFFVGAFCGMSKITGPMKGGTACDFIHPDN